MKRTRREQTIEQVGLIIAEGHLDWEDTQRINGDTGWTFEVRWDDGEYTRETNFTRVEGEQLSKAALQLAYETAQRWLRNPAQTY